ncbi:RT0821/Lpp0805 family surface protein [Candidatus Ferrigenium straubiae]|jgi:surface antigen|uniref:RT0821/Lpp0805 family surface protein n=1 Tax=Candidatus Ferrigenium straubiae TaxID=2919506 RepID=UPI003F4ACBC2
MKRILIMLFLSVLSVTLAACQTKQESGAVIGGTLGGVLGSNVGGGEGRTAAIIAGTLLGALVGSEMGRYMDENDERKAQSALEYNRDHQASTWRNPNTGADVSATPTRTFKTSDGENCREYQTTVTVSGKQEKAYGTACRQPNGSWKIVN